MQIAAKKKRKPSERLWVKIVLTAVIWIVGILMIMPFIWMVSTSFKGINDVYSFPIEWIPKRPTTQGYQRLFRDEFKNLNFAFIHFGVIKAYFAYLLNSIKVALIALVGTLCSCTMAGYAYAKIPFFGRNKIFMLKLMTTMLPGMVTMLPTFTIYRTLHLIDTHAALWIGSFCGGAFGVFLMRQAFVTIPDSLIEAARVDGAGHFRCFFSVALPNVKTSVATLLFMYFMWTWNDYERPLLYLNTQAKYTLPLAVQDFSGENDTNLPAVMAANVFMLLPIIIFFISCQKFFVESLVSSGIKG